MKALIWKELRENTRWAALAGLFLLLAEVFALSDGRQRTDLFNVTLGGSAFLLVSGYGCAAIGTVLGLLQFLPDLPRDRWASLLHRPVSRHVIFLGKVSAGLALYALATGLPLLLSIVYVAWPGNFPAPFTPALAGPALSDVMFGIVFYFAAQLLCLHSGSWFGARGAVALGVVAILMLHLRGAWPFLLPLLASTLFLLAAWGAMGRSSAAFPWVSRLALGTLTLFGLQVALMLGATGLLSMSRPPPEAEIDSTTSMLWIGDDGTVFTVKTDRKGGQTLTDEKGNTIDYRPNDDNAPQRNFRMAFPFMDRRSASSRFFSGFTARSSRDAVGMVNRQSQGPESWYLLAGPRGYFVGYDNLSRRRIGICDTDGFKPGNATPHPFSVAPQFDMLQQRTFLFWAGPQVFELDFAARRMTALFHSGKETIHAAVRFPYASSAPRVAVGLDSQIHFLESNGAPVYAVPYGYEAALFPQIHITASDDFSRTFLQYWPLYTAPSPEMVMHLDVIDTQGQRIATHTTPFRIGSTPRMTWNRRLAELANLPIPTLLTTLQARAAGSVSPEKPSLVSLLALAAGLSVAAGIWAHRVRLSLSQTGLWVLLTMVFGLAGMLAYRLVATWPARVRCPHCARRRSVSAATCAHCDAPWEPLPASGAEIFESA